MIALAPIEEPQGAPPVARGASDGWVDHELGWAAVRLPPTWVRSKNCGPARSQQACGPTALAIQDWVEKGGSRLSVLVDGEFVPDSAPEGGYTEWSTTRQGDRLVLTGSPRPGRCPPVASRTKPCENIGGLSIQVLDKSRHWFYVLLGSDKELTAEDLATFRKVVESIRLKLDGLPTWDGGLSQPARPR
jgi:hypothetical protein